MQMGDEDARHLVGRTGLGTHPSEIARFARMGRGAAVDTLLKECRTTPATAPPAWATEPPLPRQALLQTLGNDDKLQELLRERGLELKKWWFAEMMATPSPMTERLTLFWHNHFTSSMQKVKRAELIFRQNQLLRKHALGSFAQMLRGVLRDPAMLVYLDNVRNSAQKPNENLGRELLELFTLGEGEYTEADVKAAARALTGRTVRLRDGEFRNATWAHDSGAKTFLGRTRAFDGDSLIDVILEHPAAAKQIARKLRAEFITTPPSGGEVDRLGRELRSNGWSIASLLRSILTSADFWADANRGTRIKAPVDLLVGTARTLELRVPSTDALVQSARALGQDILDPPNVKGWAGGDAWITSNSLLRRVTIMDRAATMETRAASLDAWFGTAFAGKSTDDRLAAVLLAVPPMQPVHMGEVRPTIHAILTDPTYQLG